MTGTRPPGPSTGPRPEPATASGRRTNSGAQGGNSPPSAALRSGQRGRGRYNTPDDPSPGPPAHDPGRPRRAAADHAALRRVRRDDGGADGADGAVDRRDAAGAAADPRRVRPRPTPTASSSWSTSYVVGFAVGQLFHGPLSDWLGRKPVLLVGPRGLRARLLRLPRRRQLRGAARRPLRCRGSPTPRRGSSRSRWCATSTAGGGWPRSCPS